MTLLGDSLDLSSDGKTKSLVFLSGKAGMESVLDIISLLSRLTLLVAGADVHVLQILLVVSKPHSYVFLK